MPDHDDGNQGGSEQKYKWLFEIPRVRPPWMLTTSKSYGLFAFFFGSHSPMVPALLNGLRINIKNAFSLKIFLTLVQISLPPWLQTEWTQRFPLPRVVQSRRGGAEGSHCRVLMEKSARHEWRGDLRQLLRLGRKTRAKAQHMEGIFVQQSTVVNLFISRLLWVTAAPLRTYAWKCSCKDIDSVKKLFQGSQVWYSSMITILIIYLE